MLVLIMLDRGAEHRGFALGCGLGRGAALKPHWGFIHYRTRSNQHRGFEFAPAGLVGAWLLGATGAQFTAMPVRIPLFRIIKMDTQMGVHFDWWSIGDSNP